MHVVGTAGHVDHGKSTLVQALTGIDPDRFEEEKRRGLTIDLGFAWCTLPSGREIGIVDVPGHERFIRNMLSGVGSIDAALFVVAADEGWMPQSTEHLQILDFLDISGGVVALTKSDAVDEEELELAREIVWQRLRGTALHQAAVVPVSAKTGAGLEALRSALDELLAAVPEAADHNRPRLFVDRSFTIAGAGTVVTGTLTRGSLHVGEDVEIVPARSRARIRALQTHRRSVDEARPGSRVAANLVGLERTDVTRGDALVRPGQWRVTRTFAARLATVDDLTHAFTARGAYELYLGTSDFRCRVKLLEDAGDNDAIVAAHTPSGIAPAIRSGGSALVQIFYTRGLPVGVGDRFVIRDVGRRETVAGGIVLDQDPEVIRRGDSSQLKRLRARGQLEGVDLAQRILAERGAVAVDEVAVLAGVAPETVVSLPGAETLNGSTTFVIEQLAIKDLESRTFGLVGAYHEAHPLAAGMPVHELRSALGIDENLLGGLIQRWERTRVLVRNGSVLKLPEHEDAVPAEQRVSADVALEKLRVAGASPPSLRDVGVGAELAKALERANELVVLSIDIGFPADVWSDIERRIVDLIAAEGPATVARVREALGTSRKYAVPILERLDATGITRRRGDVRDLGPRGREIA